MIDLKQVPALAITFVVIAIVIGVGATILTQFQANVNADAGTLSVADSNSVTTVNGTQVFFADSDQKGNLPVACSSVKVYNGTKAEDVTHFFTVEGCYATLSNTSFSATAKQFNYTLVTQQYSTAYNTTEDGLDASTTLSSWQGTWVVIVASAIVLGIIGGYLMYR